ncbi:MAG: hypothetical protein HZA10_05355 [Nitrospirae bacterium]|nr:hypothetical protein [Nitrospirota bacterium]
MRQTVLKNTVDVLHKIKIMEKEIMNLKLYVFKKLAPSGKKVAQPNGKKCSLAGIIDIAKDCRDTDLSVHHDKYLYGEALD